MSTWIRAQSELYKELDATFKRHDENGDGVLSLQEFTGTQSHRTQAACFAAPADSDSRCVATAAGIVQEVDKHQKRFPRPVKEIRKMYLEAINESASGDDAITQVAFTSVAQHYHLGVPFVDPSRCVHCVLLNQHRL